ncbi:MAG: TrbC/VirB2 family protein [Parcubacteria group bacterium]|jgi:hypothetical protein
MPYKKIMYPLIIPIIACAFAVGICVTDIHAVESGEFKNPLSESTVEGALGKVLTAVQGIIAILAVLMIVVGGLIYITSGGESGRVDLAKKAVTAAIIGLAIALAAPALLKEIYTILGGTAPSTVTVDRTLTQIIEEALKFLLSIIGTLSVIMLVVGGIMYITSAGSDRADMAKKTIQYAIIGLVVSLLSLVIVTQVIKIF